MATTTLSKQDAEQLAQELRPILQTHELIYAVVKHVSRSGMSRVIDFYVVEDQHLRRISHLLAAVYNRDAAGRSRGWTYDRGGVVVRGCGMDMGWHLVYEVRYALRLGEWRNGEEPFDASCKLGYGFRLEYL